MIIFKACGKCEGDLYVERDLGDTDLVCLQCGYRRPVRTASDDLPPRQLSGAQEQRELLEVGV